MVKNQIKFQRAKNSFYKDLKEEVDSFLSKETIEKARKMIVIKFTFYFSLFILFYINIFNPHIDSNIYLFIINYVLLGLTGILLAINTAHDCVHNTFSKSKKVNDFVFYIVFNLQGINYRLWQKRHVASHHIYPNIDGSDAEIEQNPFVRITKTQKKKSYQQYQHFYAIFLYFFYILHWILIKDIHYLFKKNLGSLKNLKYTKKFIIELVSLKLFYFGYMIFIPYYFTDFSLGTIIVTYLIMSLTSSIFFVLTLIISHLSMETSFPTADEEGKLPYDYFEHQLAASLDFHPTSKMANWIFGGFNSHTAHHLFPNLPHTVYTEITPIIQKYSKKYDMLYKELPIPKAIKSHFRYLKVMGEG